MASEKIINQKKEEVANLAAKMKEAKIGSNYKYEIDITNNNENVSFRTTNLEKIT